MNNLTIQKTTIDSCNPVGVLKKRVGDLESTNECCDFLKGMLDESRKDEVTQRKLNALVMEYATCCIAVVSATGETLLINRRVSDLLGYDANEMIKVGLHDVFKQHPNHQDVEQLLERKDGSSVLVGMTVAAGMLESQSVYIVVFNDITEKKNYENEIKALSTFPSENPYPVWRIDLNYDIIYMNDAAKCLSDDTLLVKNIVKKDLWKQTLYYVIDHKQNSEVEIEVGSEWFKCLFTYTDHGYINVYGINISNRVKATLALHKAYSEMEAQVEQRTKELSQKNKQLSLEIIERKKVEDKLRVLSYQDALTGLGNRRRMTDRLEHAVLLGKRNFVKFALLFLDLDHFKNINDTLGHDAGDDLLKQVAYRLESSVRTSDTVVRMGGDEFAILLENIQGEDEVFKVAETIINKFNEAFTLNQANHKVHCSLGISLFPEHADSVEELFKCADIALYKAKEVRNNYMTYNAMADSKTDYLNQLNHDLQDSLEKNQLYLLFQPKVRLSDGKIIGAEALIRWKHPEFGIISPVEFIPIAEGNGMMVSMGDWILQEACHTLKLWEDQGHADLCMAINLSPMQFVESNLFDKVIGCMDKYNIQPNHLELEITETLTMDDPDRSQQTIQKFIDLGISMAIDDFGTGYSSLARLKEMPIQTLKIDRSFISDICNDHNDRVFVEMIINMSKLLNLVTVAEGVEDIEHINFLQKLGCDIGQGYYFSPPVSSKVFLELLAKDSFQTACKADACASCGVKKCVVGTHVSQVNMAILEYSE